MQTEIEIEIKIEIEIEIEIEIDLERLAAVSRLCPLGCLHR